MARIVHFEQFYKNPVEATVFYKKIFDWEINNWGGEQPYWLVTTGPDSEMGINGGFAKKMENIDQPVIVTIAVDNIDKYIKKVEESGAKQVLPKSAIPGMGHMAYYTDPGGVVFGMFQTDESATYYAG